MYNTDPEYHDAIIALLDFNKAFDSISHDTIYRGLESLGAPPCLIAVIKQLLSGSTTKVQVNGVLGEPVNITRGTKQGDPISPVLFVIGLELLNRALINSNCNGFQFGASRTVASLFADDTALLCKDTTDLHKLLDIIRKFTVASGLKLNVSKSSCICKLVTQCLPLPRASADERYLGFYINARGLSDHTTMLCNSISSVRPISGLTIFGKTTVLKTYILSKLNYFMYITHPSAQLEKEVNKTINRILWNGRCQMRKERIAQPKNNGGLNIHPLSTRSSAQKAWIYRRMCKHPILGPQWTIQATQLSELYQAHAAKFASKHTSLADMISSTIGEQRLTPGQRELETQLPCSIQDVFQRIHSLKIRNNIKQVYWKFYNKCLPINKQKPMQCPHDNNTDNHRHFALDCSLVSIIQIQANNTITDLMGKPYTYQPDQALLLTGENEQLNILNSIVLWAILILLFKKE